MKPFSHQAHRVQRLPIFFLALSLLLIVSSYKLSADQVKQAGWRVKIEEGKQTRSTLTIKNRCSEPRRFRIKSKIKYLRFEQPTDSILIEASSNKELGVRFDATGLKSKVYRSKVVVECLDCKGSKCTQNRDEVPVEMSVIVPNIYSWCVDTHVTGKPGSFSCKVISVTPNFAEGRCAEPLLTIPNDGRVVPKAGSSLPADSCMTAIKIKKTVPDPNVVPVP